MLTYACHRYMFAEKLQAWVRGVLDATIPNSMGVLAAVSTMAPSRKKRTAKHTHTPESIRTHAHPNAYAHKHVFTSQYAVALLMNTCLARSTVPAYARAVFLPIQKHRHHKTWIAQPVSSHYMYTCTHPYKNTTTHWYLVTTIVHATLSCNTCSWIDQLYAWYKPALFPSGGIGRLLQSGKLTHTPTPTHTGAKAGVLDCNSSLHCVTWQLIARGDGSQPSNYTEAHTREKCLLANIKNWEHFPNFIHDHRGGLLYQRLESEENRLYRSRVCRTHPYKCTYVSTHTTIHIHEHACLCTE